LPEPHHNPKRRAFTSPLTALAVSFASGIVWGHFSRPTVGERWFLVTALGCILLGLSLLRAGWDRSAVWLALAAMMLTGIADARQWEQRFPPNHVRYLESRGVNLNEPLRLQGTVISTPYRTGYGLQFDVESQRVESRSQSYRVTGKIRLRGQGLEDREDASGRPAKIEFGDEIRALVQLRQPHIYQNPGSFDFRRWMEDIEDLYWVGTIENPRLVEIVRHPAGFHFAEIAEGARQRLLRGIDDIYPPWSNRGRYGAVLKAVLWGDRTALDSTTIEDFRKTGLYHLLVIAGLHVGLLTLLVEFLLRGLGFRRASRTFIMLGFLMVYAFLVEQRAPTLRATLMISLYLLARILDRRHSPLNSLGGVALILLYFRPAWLFESGFQLSFAAALLIVGVAVPILERTTEPYRRALRRLDDILLDDHFSPRLAQTRLDLRSLVYALRRRAGFLDRFPAFSRNIVVVPLKLLLWVVNIVAFSAILQLGLLLPMVETFHRVTFAGVGLNALAIPLMTLLLALALPINLISVASPAAAAWPAKLLSMVMALLFDMTHLPGLAAWLSYRMPTPPLWVAWGFCGAFVLAGLSLRLTPRLAGAALTACALFVGLVAVQPFAPRLPHGVTELTALDCGRAGASFLVLPNGTTMLVDAGDGAPRARQGGFQGRRWNAGEDIVSPYLWSRGIKRIDVVVLTQASPDRIGGLYAILENFRVGEFWHAPQPENPDYAELLERVADLGIPTRALTTGDTLSFGNASVRVLWPQPESANVTAGFGSASVTTALKAGQTSVLRGDDDSLVMRISYRGVNLVLSGIPGKRAEQIVIATGDTLESEVLRIGYRGIKPPSEADWQARLAPRAVILAGDGATGGSRRLPNSETHQAVPDASTKVFRPDVDGATTVSWNGEALAVHTYRGGSTVVRTAAGSKECCR
jgi:competence protein ComEC